MRNPKVPLLALGAYLALIGVLAISTSPTATGQKGSPPGPDVRVINTTAESLPVSIEGSKTIPVAVQGPTVIDSSHPVMTNDVDNPARHPFQKTLRYGQSPFTVPTGKRLVIEFVTFAGNVNDGDPFSGSIDTVVNGEQVRHYFQLHETHTQSGRHMFIDSQTTRIYADPGTDVFAGINFRGDEAFMDASISGYLLDMP